MNIGIDFGNVLSILDEENKSRNLCMNMPFALDSLFTLKSQGHKLFLISFCGKSRPLETSTAILKEYPDLFENMFLTRAKKYKLEVYQLICADILIDDTLEILQHVNNNAPNILTIHFNPQNPIEWKCVLSQVSNIKLPT